MQFPHVQTFHGAFSGKGLKRAVRLSQIAAKQANENRALYVLRHCGGVEPVGAVSPDGHVWLTGKGVNALIFAVMISEPWEGRTIELRRDMVGHAKYFRTTTKKRLP